MFICHKHGTKKNLSPQEDLNPWPPRYQLGAQTIELHETPGELGHLLGSYVPCFVELHIIINFFFCKQAPP